MWASCALPLTSSSSFQRRPTSAAERLSTSLEDDTAMVLSSAISALSRSVAPSSAPCETTSEPLAVLFASSSRSDLSSSSFASCPRGRLSVRDRSSWRNASVSSFRAPTELTCNRKASTSLKTSSAVVLPESAASITCLSSAINTPFSRSASSASVFTQASSRLSVSTTSASAWCALPSPAFTSPSCRRSSPSSPVAPSAARWPLADSSERRRSSSVTSRR
mmetsp:Transcript_115672/g.360305  ORF Transcript_115672/g.360305 Transcript_115672/m.360305 type:complete len:221 (+) Transcript_115672:459-1121(+)